MPNVSPSRRQFLAGGLATVATATAGCQSLGTESSERNDSKQALRLTLSRDEGPLREEFVVDLARTSPPWDEDAFAAAREGETYTTQYWKPFFATPDDPVYTRHEGTYYQLGSVVVDEVTTTHPVVRLRATETSTPPTDAVATTSLPEVDQRAVRVGHLAARARGNEGGYPQGLVQRGGYVYRDSAAIETSDLLATDGSDTVTYRNTAYTVEISEETFHEPVYRATATAVAEDPERMEAILRARFVDARVDRAALSTDAREIIEIARADGYSETHPYSAGYQEVLRTFHRRAFIDGNIEKDAGVRDDGSRQLIHYDDTYYDYRLRFVTAKS